MIPEEIYYELKALMEQADKADGEMDQFETSLVAHCNKLIAEIYGDQLLTMESEGFKQIKDKLWRVCMHLTVDINNIIYRNQVKE
ncbi:MAG: hypothetical protein ABL876_03115 [Chitinophagaceae bacterium]